MSPSCPDQHQFVLIMDTSLSYPVGRHSPEPNPSPEVRVEWIARVRVLPDRLEEAVEGLNDGQLDTRYREGGWTIRQVVHHVADSHLNAYCRLKLALTEEAPVIRPYEQDPWASLPDSKLPVGVSLGIVRGLHARLSCLLESMGEEDFQRPWIHPEIGTLNLTGLLDIYQWHGRHHVAHITRTRDRHGW